MKNNPEPVETPLPATIKFVALLGAIIVIGWLLMFRLTVIRW